MGQEQPQVDWSDSTAVEQLLASEGLGVIDREIQGVSDDAIIRHYAEVTPGTELEIQTVRDTIDRYHGDMVGAAIASHFTGALAAELPLSGIVGEEEASVIDDVTAKILQSGLSGITLQEATRFFGVNLELGGLHGLLELRDHLESLTDDDKTQLTTGIRVEDADDDHELSFNDEVDDSSDEEDFEDTDDDTEAVTENGETFEF